MRITVLLVVAGLISLCLVIADTQSGKNLTAIYQNKDFQITGVTVSKSGRLFVNFPRWSDRYLNAVVEVKKDGTIQPYPDEYWNRWDNKIADASKQFVCVQNVVADDRDSLWVLDPAAPMLLAVVPGGAKLVKIDLSTNQVSRVYSFGSDAVKPNSYLNDVRVDTKRHVAYITDSGAGAIVIVNLDSGKAWRALDGDASTMPENNVAIDINGKAVVDANSKTPQIAADSIALSNDGEYLYYKPLTGATLYRIKTSYLRDPGTAANGISRAVEEIARVFPTDGFWMDSQDRLYLSNLNESAIYRITKDGPPAKLLHDPRLTWPDTFSQGPDGKIYISASHINEGAAYNHGKSIRTTPYAVFSFTP